MINFKGNEEHSVSEDTIDRRRVVFISLSGLYKSYKQCPSHVLYTSLMILPLKRSWIYNPSRYAKQLKAQFVGMDVSFKGIYFFIHPILHIISDSISIE